MVCKEDLTIQELITLLSIIGAIEKGVRVVDLDTWQLKLVKMDLVRVFDDPAFTRIDSPYTSNGDIVKKFTQTLKGEVYLSLWTIEELLEIVLTYIGKNTFCVEYALIYIVRRLPLETLPEFLAHSYSCIRWEAETRLKELQNGN